MPGHKFITWCRIKVRIVLLTRLHLQIIMLGSKKTVGRYLLTQVKNVDLSVKLDNFLRGYISSRTSGQLKFYFVFDLFVETVSWCLRFDCQLFVWLFILTCQVRRGFADDPLLHLSQTGCFTFLLHFVLQNVDKIWNRLFFNQNYIRKKRLKRRALISS